MPLFKGFRTLVYPEYDVIVPQTLQTFSVRTMTVQDEERLKGSFKLPNRLVEVLNQTLWDCIVRKPDHIRDYSAFMKNVTLKDRDALLYGLYHVTYGDIRNYDLTCSSCGKDYSVSVNLAEAFSVTPYNENVKVGQPVEAAGMSILQKKVSLQLVSSPNISVVLRQPTIFMEEDATKNYAYPDKMMEDLVTETLVIEKIVETLDSGSADEYTAREDIISAYISLPSPDRKLIFNKYKDEFGKYGIELKFRSKCVACGETQVSNIDLVSQFFRMVFGSGLEESEPRDELPESSQ